MSDAGEIPDDDEIPHEEFDARILEAYREREKELINDFLNDEALEEFMDIDRNRETLAAFFTRAFLREKKEPALALQVLKGIIMQKLHEAAHVDDEGAVRDRIVYEDFEKQYREQLRSNPMVN